MVAGVAEPPSDRCGGDPPDRNLPEADEPPRNGQLERGGLNLPENSDSSRRDAPTGPRAHGEGQARGRESALRRVLTSTATPDSGERLAEVLQDFGLLDDLGDAEAQDFGLFTWGREAGHDNDREPGVRRPDVPQHRDPVQPR